MFALDTSSEAHHIAINFYLREETQRLGRKVKIKSFEKEHI